MATKTEKAKPKPKAKKAAKHGGAVSHERKCSKCGKVGVNVRSHGRH